MTGGYKRGVSLKDYADLQGISCSESNKAFNTGKQAVLTILDTAGMASKPAKAFGKLLKFFDTLREENEACSLMAQVENFYDNQKAEEMARSYEGFLNRAASANRSLKIFEDNLESGGSPSYHDFSEFYDKVSNLAQDMVGEAALYRSEDLAMASYYMLGKWSLAHIAVIGVQLEAQKVFKEYSGQHGFPIFSPRVGQNIKDELGRMVVFYGRLYMALWRPARYQTNPLLVCATYKY